MSGIDVSPALSVSARRFRDARADDWERLEEMLDEIEKGKASALDDEELFDLPVLYRSTLSSLSVARETSLDADLVGYLESLSTRAYFILYGVHSPFWKRVLHFFADELPSAVRGLWRETLVSLLLTIVGAVSAYAMVRGNPDWYFGFVGGDMSQGRDPSATVEALRATIHGAEKDYLSLFATFLFVHNAGVSLLCFALGFAFAVPTSLLVLYNGCTLGAMYAVFDAKGLGPDFGAWLAIHGTTEMFAIILAGAAGMRIGMATAFPGRLSRLTAAVKAGRSAGFVMVGVLTMLLVAGVLEGIGRQMVDNTPSRALIGGAMLLFWLIYYYLKPARPRGSDKP